MSCMKKVFFIVIFVSFFSICLFANPAGEREEHSFKVNLGVMQGPTGFSSAMLPEYIDVSVYPSPNETISKLVNGELDMAVLPANTALNVFNKGVNIKFVAIVGEGMLSVLGSDNAASELYVPGAGGTPDHMANLLFPEYKRNYSITAPVQLAQMLIAGKCSLAILPQPFVNMAVNKNPDIRIIADVQKYWEERTAFKQYPMSVLVVSAKFALQNPKLVESVKKDYENSIRKVLSDADETAKIIEEKGIMKADLARASIKDCAIVFKEGRQAEKELLGYYEVLMSLAPEAIGGNLPDFDVFCL